MIRSRFRGALPYLVLGAIALIAIEGPSYLVGRILRARGVFYLPEATSGFEAYMARRDPQLGWPSPSSFGQGSLDPSGSRRIPAFPEPGRACVSLYGDSFTFGEEVGDEEAWSNKLSLRLGCRVANYGVGGYGTDQALLRFEKNLEDEAPVVVLAHLSENVMRNVNQLRGLLYTSTRWGLKPRYILGESEELELIPLPTPSADEFARLLERPETYLEHDYFIPGGEAGVSQLRPPYSLSIIKGIRHFHVRAAVRRRPWYAEFYDGEHTSGALEVTARIIARFEKVARARGKVPITVVIPTGLDLTYHERAGVWTYGALLARVHSLGVEPLDLGPPFLEHATPEDPCSVYFACNRHLNARGNELVATLVGDLLVERRMLRDGGGPRMEVARRATSPRS